MFGTARALSVPQPVHSVPWDVLIEKLRAHYAPAPSKIAQRFTFRQRLQLEEESINQYIAALQSAALYCDFTDLEENLLDQLVCGVSDLKLQRHLKS